MSISPFLLERHFAKYEFELPFQLSCSDCEPLGQAELLSMAMPESARLWDQLKLSYTDSMGHPLLRSEIARLYDTIDPEEILVCAPEEGIFLAMNVILYRGDHLIVISPAYQSLHEIATSLGCTVSHWRPDTNGSYSVESIQPLLTTKTRMVVINFPHNPTGSLITTEELSEIASLCRQANVILFSDEMYRGTEQNPMDRMPCAAELGEHVIALSGMSKSFALPGLRIGWLVCKDPQIMKQLITLKDYTTICSSAPSEILAVIGLQNRSTIWERNIQIILKNLPVIEQLVNQFPQLLNWTSPKAGSVGLLYLNGGLEARDVCNNLLKQYEVLSIGSHLFEYDSQSLRLGFGRRAFPQALDKFAELLKLRVRTRK